MLPESKDTFQKFQNWKELGNWNREESYDDILQANNPLCGDEIILYVSRNSLGTKIMRLGGESCSVCSASAGLLDHRRKNWNKDSLIILKESIEKFLNDGAKIESIAQDDAEFWNLVKNQPNRYRCALLPIVALGKGF